MKKIILIILIIFLSPIILYADSPKKEKDFFIEQDRWDKDRYNVIDSKTKRKSETYIKKDRWQEDKWNIYDKHNQEKGYIEKDRWNKDRWNINKD